MTDAAEADEAALGRTVGERIRAARRSRRLSMVELAARAEISQPFLSKVERGITTPSLHTLYRLGSALGVMPSELMPQPEPAAVTVVRAAAGAAVTAVDDPGSPTGRLLRGGEGSRIELFDYRVDAHRNVDEWFEYTGEAALVLLSGRLDVEVEERGTWSLEERDVLFLRGRFRTRWTATGTEQASVLLFSAQ
ncbi:helix-turn-helix domain-containing protein [Microbacterium sp. No. 7]|uniref:helix-turn-helix domain-containing protein n=1 Tax=Microbacterium sp. No. 7 TaxID=1714373 RepID=UPI0006CF29E7|nr:helix-turn-helix domain-containing protein [Microbacterium sp. No. 7]